jgi:DNA-binding response OmpR family regulator
MISPHFLHILLVGTPHGFRGELKGMDRTACIVCNDRERSQWLEACLGKEGFSGFLFFREEQWPDACLSVRIREPDLVIFDLPAFNSFTFDALRELRFACCGILIALMDWENDLGQTMAFDLGVDDVVSKPYSERLLHARLRSNLRKGRPGALRQQCITINDLTVHAGRREAILKGEPLELTTLLFDLLWFLVRNAGSVVTRGDLGRHVFDARYKGVDRSIDVYISRLRQKLEDDPARPSYLKTVRGEGYLFVSGGKNG